MTQFDELVSKLESKTTGSKSKNKWIVQRYVNDPCLVDGLKFDMRIYVLLHSIEPLSISVSQEGICRFATAPFEPINAGSPGGQYSNLAHITSYSLNRNAEAYNFDNAEALSEETLASKRPLSTVLGQLRKRFSGSKRGFSETDFWRQVQQMALMASTAMLPTLRSAYSRQFGIASSWLSRRPLQGFHMLGLDVVMNADFGLNLVQAVSAPSMAFTQAIPCAVRTGKLPQIKVSRKQKARAEERAAAVDPAGGGKTKRGSLQGDISKSTTLRRYGGDFANEVFGLATPPPAERCTCSELGREHIHEISRVDLQAKSIALAGMLEQIPKLVKIKRSFELTPDEEAAGIGQVKLSEEHRQRDVYDEHWFPCTDVTFVKAWQAQRLVELVYDRLGGVKKCFAAGGLRKLFSKIKKMKIKKKSPIHQISMDKGIMIGKIIPLAHF